MVSPSVVLLLCHTGCFSICFWQFWTSITLLWGCFCCLLYWSILLTSIHYGHNATNMILALLLLYEMLLWTRCHLHHAVKMVLNLLLWGFPHLLWSLLRCFICSITLRHEPHSVTAAFLSSTITVPLRLFWWLHMSYFTVGNLCGGKFSLIDVLICFLVLLYAYVLLWIFLACALFFLSNSKWVLLSVSFSGSIGQSA